MLPSDSCEAPVQSFGRRVTYLFLSHIRIVLFIYSHFRISRLSSFFQDSAQKTQRLRLRLTFLYSGQVRRKACGFDLAWPWRRWQCVVESLIVTAR